ncbi:MAG TPA: hypothetical protein DD673_09235 [Lentisphaeria bacterium]|nr:hypothetical protein [Lentisphaeria bacterium]
MRRETMEEKNTTKRREWVKNAAIIFLTIMLLLTFFSNTIMNYSLPEVATQYVQTGTITAKVRGTGKVEASDPYNVIAKESRVITSVAVKQGDIVEKDQVIYYLEESESDELTKAEQELEDLELNYMKGLFGANVSPEVITKVANGNIDSFSQLQAKVTDMQNRLEAAKKRVEECQKNVDDLTLQSTKDTNNAGVSTKNEELTKDQATTDLTEAQNRFEKDKAATIASLNAQITEVNSQIADLEKLLASTGTTGSTSGSTGSGYYAQMAAAVGNLYDKMEKIYVAAAADSGIKLSGVTLGAKEVSSVEGVRQTLSDTKNTFDKLQTAINAVEGKADSYTTLFADYNAALLVVQNIEQNASDINKNYGDQQTSLASKKAELANLQKKLAEVQAITASSDGGVQDAQNRLNQANRNILEITTANSQTSVAWQNRLADANAALKNAQAVYDLLKEEQTSLAADINAELDLSKTNKDIQKKKEEIEKLKEKSMGSAVKAPVAGTITTVKYVAGETTQPEDVMAVIQPEGKGFTLSISVTNEQAKKVQIGDMAELQNSWYYDDARVMLSAIKPDPDNPGTNKLLVFDVSGSTIQADQSLSISVGQRSQEYELVVPNSAIREDNDGKFILTVESKSSPLGNRYIATRVGVEVLASDDNNSAISAPLYGWEYVITTSTKPVEAGKQVRLADNS